MNLPFLNAEVYASRYFRIEKTEPREPIAMPYTRQKARSGANIDEKDTTPASIGIDTAFIM